ncbi:polyhomeotic-like protein 2 [Ranitomeya imitator]|uniref:polyhomeotic-like protein 2 n=1 Tax=Ranitomeya imitator TaxID=111125 RepID=UPI0037E87192
MMEYGPPSSRRPAVPPSRAVHSGIPERQMVKVIRQVPETAARQGPETVARQAPSTAAQYLQQMYAAQQQHLMLQTTALRQQANRTPPAVSASQPTPSQPLMLIFTPVASMSSVPAAVTPGATSQVQNLTLRAGSTAQSQPLGPPAAGPPETVTSSNQETSSKTPEPLTVQPPNTPALSPALSGALKIPPRQLLPPTQVPQCLGSAPVASAVPCAMANGPRGGLGAPWSPAEVSVQRQLLLGSPAAVLQIAAAPGASPPAAETPYNPSLKGCSPVPAAESIPGALDRCPVHGECSSGGCQQEGAPSCPCAGYSAPPGSPDSRPPLDMTSGNGSSPIPAAATGNAPQNGESHPPQAAVKPQILTHVIEGFVIQEGGQPFPSHRSRAVREVGPQEKQQTENLPKQHDPNTTTDSEMEETFTTVSKEEGNPPKLKCELCGRVDFEYKFKRSKRFCSMACAKRYNVGCTKRVGLFHPDRSKLQKPVSAKPQRRRSRKRNLQSPSVERMMPMSETITPISVAPLTTTSNLNHNNSQEDSSRCSDHSSYEEPLSPMSAISSLSRRRHFERGLELTGLQRGLHNFLPRDPTKWNVEDVYEFIRSLPGCKEISEEFRVQEIDGQALLLLKEDHLMGAMNIKLGPALKLYARISMLKDS